MLNYVLIAVALFIVYKLFANKSDEAEDVFEPIEFQKFTPRTLAKYNGKADKRVLMAVNGKVYDVSASKNHYGPGGMYENFAGRDASRGLAKHSFEVEHLTPLDQPIDDLKDLTEEERLAMLQWAEFFGNKYPHCGDLVENL